MKYIALWDDDLNEYKWYKAPEQVKVICIEIKMKDGSYEEKDCHPTNRFLTRTDGKEAEIFE